MVSAWLMCHVICALAVVDATHFRGGHMWFRPIDTSGKIQLSYRLAWRRNFDTNGKPEEEGPVFCDTTTIHSARLIGPGFDSGIQCRSGCTGRVGTTKIKCTEFSSLENWTLGENKYQYTFPFPGTGEYIISWQGKGWLETLVSGADRPWEMRVHLHLGRRTDTGLVNRSPVSAMPPVVRLLYGYNHTVHLPANDDDGDTVKCRWARKGLGECGHDDICSHAVGTMTGCTITTGANLREGYYPVAVQLDDYSATNPTTPLSSVPLQFLVYVYKSNATNDTKPEVVDPPYEMNECIAIKLNVLATLKIVYQTKDSSTSIVAINVNGPQGMRKSPLLKDPTHPRRYYVTVSGTRTVPGSATLCYWATDSHGVSSDYRCIFLAIGATQPYPVSARPINGAQELEVTFDQEVQRPIKSVVATIRSGSAGPVLQRTNILTNTRVRFAAKIMVIPLDWMVRVPGEYSVDLPAGAARSSVFCGVSSRAKRLQYIIDSPSPQTSSSRPAPSPAPTVAPDIPETTTTTQEPSKSTSLSQKTSRSSTITQTPTTSPECDRSYLKIFRIKYHGYPYCIRVDFLKFPRSTWTPTGGPGLYFNGKGPHVRIDSDKFPTHCFGDLRLCKNGYTSTFWFKVPNDRNRTIMCTDGGKMFTVKQLPGHGLLATFHAGNKIWTVSGGREVMSIGAWNHVAITWRKEDGPLLYINGKRVGCGDSVTISTESTPVNKYFVGKSCDGKGTPSEVSVDYPQFWQRWLPWTEITKEYNKYGPYVYTKDPIYPPYKPFPDPRVYWNNNKPPEVCGYIAKGLGLDGKTQYVTLNKYVKSCLGVPDYCDNGFTVSLWMRLVDKDGDQCVISSNGQEQYVGFSICYNKASGFSAYVRSTKQLWSITEPKKIPGFQKWVQVVLSWKKTKGLYLYQNGNPHASATIGKAQDTSDIQANNFTLGKASHSAVSYTGGRLDQVYFWQVYMNSSEILHRYKSDKCLQFPMDEIRNGVQLDADVPSTAVNTPRLLPNRGICDNAIELTGAQFINITNDRNACYGNLDKCPNGYTFSIWLKILNVSCSRYIASNGGQHKDSHGMALRYVPADGLVAFAKTKQKLWRAAYNPGILPRIWYHVIMTWTQYGGIKLYVNGTLVTQQRTSITQSVSKVLYNDFFIGRSNSGDSKECKSPIVVDDLRICDKEKFPRDFGHKYVKHVVEPTSFPFTEEKRATWIIYVAIAIVAFIVIVATGIILWQKRVKPKSSFS